MEGEITVTATQRALALLASFTPQRPELTLSELSRAAALPLTTTHRQVGELVRWGALERGDDGRYRIGLRLWEVASLAPRSLGLREAALPFLQDLYEATHENVQLAIRDGLEVVYVERITGHDAVHVVTRPGSRMPLHATGVGLVLLAHAPHEDIERAVGGVLKRYTDYTIADAGQLRRTLAAVRRDGYVISDRQIELVSASVAAPVYGPQDTVIAALSVVVPASGARTRALVAAVRTSARGISRSLGATSP
jgi:DNA-binding IclR family transcriptional regulator